ncbi:Procathepsin L [Manis javanica]|nr:Procathepsin L [Manis javanica]
MDVFLLWGLLLAGPSKELLDGTTEGLVPCIFFPVGSESAVLADGLHLHFLCGRLWQPEQQGLGSESTAASESSLPGGRASPEGLLLGDLHFWVGDEWLALASQPWLPAQIRNAVEYTFSLKEKQCSWQDTDACNYKPEFATANDTGFVDVPRWEKALMKAMATVSPISVAIDAGHESFQFYKAGIYYDPQGSSKALDHSVLLVGYGFEGTDSNNRFWLVKNRYKTPNVIF